MTNKEIAQKFNDLAKIMELHDENPFKIRSYANAYLQLRKVSKPLSEMSDAEISGIKGVGNAISSKIRELEETGELATYKKYSDVTPPGVREMLSIKGFGPKKVRVIWKDLGAESIGELLYACNENRLVELKGFGQKTQEDLKNKLEYFLKSKDKFHYASLENIAIEITEYLKKEIPNAGISWVGEMRRRMPIVQKIELLIAREEDIKSIIESKLTIESQDENSFSCHTENNIPVKIFHCKPTEFGSKLFRYTGNREFIEAFLKKAGDLDFKNIAEEKTIFEKAGIEFIEPELRDRTDLIGETQPVLVEETQIKGVIHSHTTYSDGINSLREMAEYSRDLGFEYIGITDHSKAAFYANGLKEDRVLQQLEEIDQLNKELAPFRIFKGIESDILNDGSLDYEEDILKQFDFIIASVHSNLKMDKEKATSRLITAIENPFTTILGHPTSRLLLSREGYPLDHMEVIDACAENNVVIELNANPYRLDIDWTWIPYALEKGIMISVNPDAHSIGGIHDIHFGVLAARKGGLAANQCLNCLGAVEFADFLEKKR
jgi:DNA polymerase (family X)